MAGGAFIVGGIQSFSGVDTANPIDAESGQSTASATAHDTPSITTSSANTMIVTSHTYASSQSWTPQAGLSESFDRLSGSASATGQSVIGGRQTQAAAGASGTKRATAASSADRGNTHILALRRLVPNAPPTVTLTSPAGGASFPAPASIALAANAADSDGTVQKVEFFHGGTNLIATVTSPPYTFNWSPVGVGAYSLTAVATDNQNATTTSAPVNVTVTNSVPTVTITSPTAGATFGAPANILITASAADPDGSIQRVEFFHGGTNLITTITAPPYSFTWGGVPQGSYSLTAVAIDNANATTTSTPVNLTVRNAALHFIHVDHLNTPRLVADAAGTTVWKWDQQEPFGNNVADENPNGLGAFDLPLRLPRQYLDKETNLHYNYFRDYDPNLSRYIQSDPIGLAGSLNTYAYVDSMPLGVIDPAGLCPASILGDWTTSNPGFWPNDPKIRQCSQRQERWRLSGYLLWSEGSCQCNSGTMNCVYSTMYEQYSRRRSMDCTTRRAIGPWSAWDDYWQNSEWGTFMLTYDCKTGSLGKPGKKMW